MNPRPFACKATALPLRHSTIKMPPSSVVVVGELSDEDIFYIILEIYTMIFCSIFEIIHNFLNSHCGTVVFRLFS